MKSTFVFSMVQDFATKSSPDFGFGVAICFPDIYWLVLNVNADITPKMRFISSSSFSHLTTHFTCTFLQKRMLFVINLVWPFGLIRTGKSEITKMCTKLHLIFYYYFKTIVLLWGETFIEACFMLAFQSHKDHKNKFNQKTKQTPNKQRTFRS